MLGPGWCVALLRTGLGLRGQRMRAVLLSKLLAKTFALVLANSPFHATLLGVGAACDAVGGRKVGDTEMKENKEMNSLVTSGEPRSALSNL